MLSEYSDKIRAQRGIGNHYGKKYYGRTDGLEKKQKRQEAAYSVWCQALKTNGCQLYYWTNERPAAEVDFVIQKEGKIVPIEVKSGENTHARSLKHYQKLYEPELVIRISEKTLDMRRAFLPYPYMQYSAFRKSNRTCAVKKLRNPVVKSCKNSYTVIIGLCANNLHERIAGKC